MSLELTQMYSFFFIRSDQSLSCVRLVATPWTAAYQAPPPMGFSRQEYWSGLPYTMGYYSAIKRKAFESVLMRWMNLEPIIQSEVSQKEKDKYCILTHAASTYSLQSCPTLCNPMDCSLPGSSVHGILQARILEWVAVPSSRGSSLPRDQTHISYMSPAFAGKFFTTSATWEALALELDYV